MEEVCRAIDYDSAINVYENCEVYPAWPNVGLIFQFRSDSFLQCGQNRLRHLRCSTYRTTKLRSNYSKHADELQVRDPSYA